MSMKKKNKKYVEKCEELFTQAVMLNRLRDNTGKVEPRAQYFVLKKMIGVLGYMQIMKNTHGYEAYVADVVPRVATVLMTAFGHKVKIYYPKKVLKRVTGGITTNATHNDIGCTEAERDMDELLLYGSNNTSCYYLDVTRIDGPGDKKYFHAAITIPMKHFNEISAAAKSQIIPKELPPNIDLNKTTTGVIEASANWFNYALFRTSVITMKWLLGVIDLAIKNITKVDYIFVCGYRFGPKNILIQKCIDCAKQGIPVFLYMERRAPGEEDNYRELFNRYFTKDIPNLTILKEAPHIMHGKCILIKGVNNLESVAVVSTGNYDDRTFSSYIDDHLLIKHTVVSDYLARWKEAFEMPSHDASVFMCKEMAANYELFRSSIAGAKNTKVTDDKKMTIICNHLTDKRLAQELKEVAESGTDLNIYCRGKRKYDTILLPTTNTTAAFLYHTRLMVCGTWADPKVILIGSSDLRKKNFERGEFVVRLKVFALIGPPTHIQ